MGYELSEELKDILKTKEVRKLLEGSYDERLNGNIIIDEIIKKCTYRLSCIAELVAVFAKANCANITPGSKFQNVFEDLLDEIYVKGLECETCKNKGLTKFYPSKYWNDILYKEISRFVIFLEKQFNLRLNSEIKNKLNNVKIMYDAQKATQEYGSYTGEQIVEIIDNYVEKYNSDLSITSILKHISNCLKENNNIPTDNIACLKHLIKEYEKNLTKEQLKCLEKILNSLKKHKFTTSKLGCFNHNLSITLYVENIFDYSIKHHISFNNALIEVFVHELFHAFHYLMMNDKVKWKNCNQIITESFAAYFEYLYSKYRGIYGFNLESDWNNYDMYTYPYSGAKYLKYSRLELINNIHKSCSSSKYKNIDFEELFNLSLINSDCVLKVFDLLYFYDNI